MLKSKIYLVEVNSLALEELDLLIECSLRADSYFITIGNIESASMMRDCADITVLLVELMKRKSSLEISYLNLCIDTWHTCRKTLSEHRDVHELKNAYNCFEMCIASFRKYSLMD